MRIVGFLAAVLALLSASRHAWASDYSHECRTADGRYEISDGSLYAAGDTERRVIAYETVKERVLSEKRGYCIARGRNYEFQSKSYVMTIRFRVDGMPVQADALCELAADGLPAAYRCEREVVTEDSTSGESGEGGGEGVATLWDHNGSIMKLESRGADRRFVYERPRRGMVEAGARRGDAVFEGRREGDSYSGTAYIFSRSCGKLPYRVSGSVAGDDRRVVLTGQAPLVGADCRARSTKRDELVFDLIER